MEKSNIKKKSSDKASNKEFVKNTIELSPKLVEATSKTVVVSWGRMNPPTIGHEKLANKVASTAKANNAVPIVYLTHSQDAKKNPLSYEDKYMFARAAFGSMMQKSNAKTIIQVMQELQKKFTDVILVAGADRVKEFETLLNKYNGKDFTLNSIKVVSAGERDPDAEGVEGMSASKMRAAAAAGDEAAFKSGLPKKLQRLSKEVYDMVRSGMKIAEELEAEGLLSEAVLNLAQRRKRGLIMRKYKGKIAAARNRAKRRMASTDKLAARARKAAIRSIRSKVAGSKGADYANLSPSEKMMIDKRVAKRQKAIERIARKLMPSVRKAEIARLRSQNTSKNEAFEMMFGEQKQYKRYHELFNKDKTVKHDQRFKFYKQKTSVMEEADALHLIEQVANDIYNSIQLDESKIKNALFEKSEKTGIALSEITEAYNAGVDAWNETSAFDTPSQQGFANVSCMVAEKTYKDTGDVSGLAKTPNTVKGSQAHQLGVGLNLKQMMQHARSNRDLDNDGDVDKLDKSTPADIAGNEKDITKKMKAKNDAEAKHTKPGMAFEGKKPGLWDNIHARRKKGLPPKKPGEEGYPKTLDIEEKTGLWDNIHAKRKRIASGSGEKMRKPGSEGAPTKQDFKDASEAASSEDKMYADAAKTLISLLDRKKKDAKGPAHSIGYYAAQVARSYSNMSPRKLQNMVPSDYVFEEHGAGEEGTDKLAKRYKKDTPGESVNEAFENMLNEENQCALITRADMQELEKFADNLLKDYGIDVEFTKHFGDRMSDERNSPCINVKELKDFFRKIYANKGAKIKGNRGIEAILKDMQKSLNMPVVIDYKNGEVELTFKTIMRKKNFTSPNRVIAY
jgi:nicotinic acid mononucleotide adenylyltransferase